LLSQAISSDDFNSLFGFGGSLEGYVPNGIYEVNGNSADKNMIMTIINQVINQNATITNITVND
jgi:hypothetical protein